MSLKIRLSRVGAKKQASYRIVVAESSAPRDGRAIAILGHYNPLTDPYTLKVDEERALRWLNSGAQPSDTARGLLAKAGIMATYDSARKSAAKPKKADGEAASETKARRAARAKRTEAPRLARPTKREGDAQAETTVRAATTKKTTAAKGKTAAKAAKKPAGKASSGRKPAAARTARAASKA